MIDTDLLTARASASGNTTGVGYIGLRDAAFVIIPKVGEPALATWEYVLGAFRDVVEGDRDMGEVYNKLYWMAPGAPDVVDVTAEIEENEKGHQLSLRHASLDIPMWSGQL